MKKAIKEGDGLAVVGIMLYPSKDPSKASSKIGQYLIEQLYGPLQRMERSSTNPVSMQVDVARYIEEITSSKDKAMYFRYLGSLTTPGCFESVTWTVMSHRFDVDATLMSQFRRVIVDGDFGRGNYRAIQKLNGRTVYTNDPKATGSSSMATATSTLLFIAVTFAFFTKW